MSHINDQNHKATVNGSRNTNGLHTHTTEDSYSVILDLTNSTLKYREDPENHSPLIKACSQGLGPHRIQLLAYMLEHPGDPHFADNIYKGTV